MAKPSRLCQAGLREARSGSKSSSSVLFEYNTTGGKEVTKSHTRTQMSELNLYLVTAGGWRGRWDAYDGFVVCCESEEVARATHPGGRAIADMRVVPTDWVTAEQTHLLDVKLIGKPSDNLIEEMQREATDGSPDRDRYVVLESYTAG